MWGAWMVACVAAATTCALFPDVSSLGTTDAAASDSMTADGTLVDASLDALDAGPWCATHAPDGSVCFDYDESDADDASSHNITCSDNGSCVATLSVLSDTDSPPHALVLGIPKLDPYPAYAEVRSVYSWPSKPQSVTIGFDLRIDSPDASGILGAFEWSAVIYTLNIKTPTFTLEENDYIVDSGVPSETYIPLTLAIDFSTWHRFELTVSASQKTVVLRMDGATLINDTTRNVPLSGYVAFTWGVDYVNGPIPPTTYHYDNVVLVAQ